MLRGLILSHICVPPSVQYAYEDAMDLVAKLPTLASAIYCNLYRDGKVS